MISPQDPFLEGPRGPPSLHHVLGSIHTCRHYSLIFPNTEASGIIFFVALADNVLIFGGFFTKFIFGVTKPMYSQVLSLPFSYCLPIFSLNVSLFHWEALLLE